MRRWRRSSVRASTINGYYSKRDANAQMWHAPQGVHAFLRAYFHHKSADWVENKPHKLVAWRADELAKMPTYYIMDLAKDMPETVAEVMPSAQEIAACRWLPESELAVYAAEYQRTGFQGGLNWYRSRTSGHFESELQVFAGRTIDVPSMFISREERLGHLSAAWGRGDDAAERLHADAGVPPDRRRRTLGAARTACGGE